MKKPHWLRWLKYRIDYFLRYAGAFGIIGAATAIYRTRLACGKKGKPVLLQPPGFQHEVTVRQGTSDVIVFEKIFVWREYAMRIDHPVKNILDCGGNIGLSAVWFACTYPDAKVIVVEPDSKNYELLCSNTRPYPNIIPLQCAIWNKQCRLRVENPDDQPYAFRFTECPLGTPGGVDACGVGTLAERYRLDAIYILKMDIEGAEQAVFSENYLPWLKATRMLLIEFHGEERRNTVLAALSQFQWHHSVVGENDCFTRIGTEETHG